MNNRQPLYNWNCCYCCSMYHSQIFNTQLIDVDDGYNCSSIKDIDGCWIDDFLGIINSMAPLSMIIVCYACYIYVTNINITVPSGVTTGGWIDDSLSITTGCSISDDSYTKFLRMAECHVESIVVQSRLIRPQRHYTACSISNRH